MSSPELEALLNVQGHDTRLDQLRHQLDTLAERTARDEVRALVAQVDVQIEATASQRDEIARRQNRIDDEVESLKAKRDGFDKKLYSGEVSNPRELQDLQEEIDSLGRRITKLEDDELEVMAEAEPVDERLLSLKDTLAQRQQELASAENLLTAAEAEIAVQIDAESELRQACAEPVSAGVLDEYEKLRAGLGGVGVSKLIGTQCGGCHLTLSDMDVDLIKKLADGEFDHWEACGRILVP